MGVGLSFVQRVNPAWFLAGAAFFLPIAPGPSNVFLLLALIASVVIPGLKPRLKVALQQPLLLLGVVLALLLWFSLVWTKGSFDDSMHYLGKYSTLLMAPFVFGLFLAYPGALRKVLFAFVLSAWLTLLLSYGIWLEVAVLLKAFPLVDPSYPTVFKLHTTQSIVLCLGLYFSWALALGEKNPASQKKLYAFAVLFTVLAVFNLLNMTHARIGYVSLVLPLLVYLFMKFSWKGGLIAIAVVAIVANVAYFGSETVSSRVDKTYNEVVNWNPDKYENTDMGARLSWWHISLQIFQEHPVAGAGVGAYPSEFLKHAEPMGVPPHNNPHNQFFLLLTQIGLIGPLLFLAMLTAHYLSIYSLNEPARLASTALFAVFAFGNLFNSFLLDSAERTLYMILVSGFLAVAYSQSSDR